MELNQKKSKVSAEELILDPNPKITIKHDLYDFSEILELIKDYLEKIESPHPIGIYGGWGSGKTTLKNFIIESIENDPNTTIFPIDFNAWENEQQAGLLIPLLNKLFKTAGFKGEKAKKIFSVLTMSFSDIFLKLATVKLLSVKDFINFEKYVDENFLKYSEYFDKLGKARNDFKDLINQIIKNKKKGKVAIFVDELDRCNPDNAIRLLESIKNFFNVKGCVFIILVDDEILASYINKKYENTAMNGHLYLEKIVNTKFRIPKISLEKITKLFNQFAIIKPDFFTISPKMYN
ncbi:MAG: P-loop NTPase fold protein, partial [Candidatus Aminicenantia bacterium]